MDVGVWLKELGLAEHAEAFAANGVDFAILPELTNDDLKDIGVGRLADRKRLLKAIEELSSEGTPNRPEESSSIPAGERRQVTVLFADLAGYTRLTSALGAEEIHALLNRYFEAVDAVVESYGGVVDKHIGDNVMAVFGAPVAHDDDPMRALRAASTIHERMAMLSKESSRLLQAHIGIASGQVVASSTGSEAHREYTVTGDSVNLAARLQDKAQAGETLISDALRRAIGDRVDCDPLGELDIKGIAIPIRVWRVKGLRRADSQSERVSFVGRRAELAQFAGIVEVCRTTGHGQVIVVRGEAGIGKTRLVDQFATTAADQGFAMHRGLVLDFGSGEGRDAVGSVVASLLGIQLGGDKARLEAAVEAAIQEGLLSAEQRIFLADLLNLSQSLEDRAIYDAMTNAVRNEGKRTVVGDLLRRLSARKPVFVVVDDIHWADPLVLKHLSKMAATVAECPAILILTSRAEGYPLDQEWRAAIGGCPLITIDLGPLRKEDAFSLASSLVGMISQLAQSCVERAAGNPLFLEHLLRNIEDRAGEEVPATIQSLVLARIDRLSPTDKQALQAASVLGKLFSLAALRHLISSTQYACGELVQRHLVRPEGDDFLFTHALVQEGVYNSLLTARRTELHRNAAVWYGKTDLILHAEHLDRANDPAAAIAYRDAAQAKIGAFHFEAALKLVDRGIELANDPSTRSQMLCLRGEALRNLGATTESIQAFEMALNSAEDDVRRCQAWVGMAAGLRVADRQKEALVLLDQAEAAAIRHDLVSDRVQIHYLRGNLYFPLGNIDGCLTEHEKALGFARKAGSSEGEALALGGLGDAYYLRGHMRSACEQFRACIAVCQSHGYGRIEVANRHMVGWTRYHLMEHAEALEDALQAVRMATTVSHHRAKLLGLMLAGVIEIDFEHFIEAQGYLEGGLDLARSLGAGNFEAQTLRILATLYAAQGRLVEARNLATLAVEVVRKVGVTFIGPAVLATKAALIEDRNESRKVLKEAESILDSGCVAHNHFWFAQSAIEQSLATGDWDEAERYAAKLEAYTRDQPLPWSDFLIGRGRALAAWGRGEQSEAVLAELKRLHQVTVQHGLKPLASELERAQRQTPCSPISSGGILH
jgi:class 3 adenylate cyclase/tetratricopeptide (TPR) repeat protein